MKNIYLTILLVFLTSMSIDAQYFFMKIESPSILGDATKAGHVNEIELASFTYTLSNSATMPISNAIPGKVQSPLVSVTIPSGRASAELFKAVTLGTIYGKVTIFAQVNTNSSFQDYATYEFESVKFGSINTGAANGDANNLVALTFKARKFKIKYKALLPTGNLDTEKSYGWDFTTNSAL